MATEQPPRRGPQSAVRIGLPPAPLSDLYFWLMNGSWWWMTVLFVTIYLVANLTFAFLYVVEDGSISSAQPGSFRDAFFFSVQTISTIGYGTLSPQTPYAHVLVTAEAMVGLLGFALGTGLVFARFSRPSARVVWSGPMVMTRRHGVDCLMFRLGNARGNDIVQASLRIAVLKTEVSDEGHRMRKLHDLLPSRSDTPLFALTWLVTHDIDETSPLWGETAESLAEDGAFFIVTLTGIDSTFADTVHARKIYDHSDIRWGHRFVDVLQTLSDGRLQIDYSKFDDVVPDPGAARSRPARS